MKTPVAIALIIMGGLLILTPVALSQRQLQRAATFRAEHGDGSMLPDEMRPQPFGSYEWSCFAAGAVFALVGIIGVVRSRASSAA